MRINGHLRIRSLIESSSTALRNPAVLEKPLSAKDAWLLVNFYREEAGCRSFVFPIGEMWKI